MTSENGLPADETHDGDNIASDIGSLDEPDDQPSEEDSQERLQNTSTLQMDGIPVAPSVANKGKHRKIGPYKILQKIGSGGMGTVYMAEQEQPIRRRVALKIILPNPNADSDQIVARFEAERQALAMMDSPYIARIYDAGTDNESPYFVMELVKGVPFTEYCNRNRLTIRERIELFIPVCRAIQHAHTKGIIHRDLKPSNVLVALHDGVPIPKVIDFGLAKAISHQTRLTDKTYFTEFGRVVGTLEYMSPEQAEMNQLDVDTRTDIYSLGVMLYELLTGTTPLDPESHGKEALLFKLLELVREQEPPRPSARLSSSGDALSGISEQRKIPPERLRRILRDDLDWIVMKALEKDRTRRYETANEFAEELSTFLDGRTSNVRPPSLLYLLQKAFKKHRAVILTLTLILGLLAGGLAGTTQMWLEATRLAKTLGVQRQKLAAEKERAIEERNRALEAERKSQIAHARSTHYLALDRLGQDRRLDAKKLLLQIPAHHRDFLWQLTLAEASLIPQVEIESMISPDVSGLTGITFSSRNQHLIAPFHDPDESIDGFAVYSLRSGREITRTLTKTPVVAISRARGAAIAIVLCRNGDLCVWDTKQNAVLSHWSTNKPATSVAISNDGQAVAVAGTDGVRFFDRTSQELVNEISVARTATELARLLVRDIPLSLSFSPDGQMLAVMDAVNSPTVNVYNVKTGESIMQKNCETSDQLVARVPSIQFSPDGTRLAWSRDDGKIDVVQVGTWTHLATLRRASDLPTRQTPGFRFRFLPDGDGFNLDLATDFGVNHICFSGDSTRIAGSDGRNVTVWDCYRERVVKVFPIEEFRRGTTAIEFSSDCQQIGLIHQGKIAVYDVCRTDNTIGIAQHKRAIRDAVLGLDSELVGLLFDDGELNFYRANDLKLLSSMTIKRASIIKRLVVLPGRRFMVIYPYRLQIRSAEDGAVLQEVDFDQATVGFNVDQADVVAVDNSQQRVAIADRKHILILDSNSGDLVRTLEIDRGRFVGLAFSEDGSQLASSIDNENARTSIWDLATGHERIVSTSEVGRTIVFDSNTQTVVVGGDQGLSWMDIDKQRNEQTKGIVAVDALRMSSDGSTLFVVQRNGSVMIWDPTTRQPIHRFLRQTHVEHLLVDEHNGKVITVSDDGELAAIYLPRLGPRLVDDRRKVAYQHYDDSRILRHGEQFRTMMQSQSQFASTFHAAFIYNRTANNEELVQLLSTFPKDTSSPPKTFFPPETHDSLQRLNELLGKSAKQD